MAGCCGDCGVEATGARQRRTLWWVLLINAIMFGVIAAASWWGGTAALMADSVDNLGDAITYAASLWAVARGRTAKARVAILKGCLILAAAAAVTVNAIHKVMVAAAPDVGIMGGFSLLALSANLVCLGLLWRHRHEDINMSSVWHCSRNDIVTDSSVFIAAGLVWLTGSHWPDIAVAGVLAILLWWSGISVIRMARAELCVSDEPA